MSENVEMSQPEGKGMAVGGFVLSLVTLIFSTWIAGISVLSMIGGGSAWLMYVWLVLSIVSIMLSVMGMSKLGRTGGKKGLGVAGMVVGIVSTVWCIILVLGLSTAASMSTNLNKGDLEDFNKAMEDLKELQKN